MRKEKTDVRADIDNKTKNYEATEAGKLDALSGGRMTELAKKNSAHFSNASEEIVDGHLTNNNMGAYTILHQQALVEAAKGTPEAKERARALEASTMHFIADRHASGHAIDKDKVVAASGHGDGLIGNGVARILHNEYNDKGIDAENAKGEHWHAMGDSHWGERENRENRFHTAKSVYSSYSELESVLDGKKTPQQVQKDGYAAKQTAPKFDQDRQNEAERRAKELGTTDVVKENAGELGSFIWSYGAQKISDGIDWASRKASDGYGWGKEKLHNGADWVGRKASQAWDGTKDAASQAWDGTKNVANKTWEGTKNVAGQAWDGTKGAAKGTWNGVKSAGSWLGSKPF